MSFDLEFIFTEDGSPTLYDNESGEHHHSMIGAYTEAYQKFTLNAEYIIQSADSQGKELTVLDLPFGLGYNLVALQRYIREKEYNLSINCAAIEIDSQVIQQIDSFPEGHELKLDFRQLKEQIDNKQIELYVEDLRDRLPRLVNEGRQYDLILYDPFSPRSTPELWSQEGVLSYLAGLLSDNGLFITYSASNKVRRGLRDLGLYIAPSNPVGRRMPGTIAAKNINLLPRNQFTEETLIKIDKAKPYP